MVGVTNFIINNKKVLDEDDYAALITEITYTNNALALLQEQIEHLPALDELEEKVDGLGTSVSSLDNRVSYIEEHGGGQVPPEVIEEIKSYAEAAGNSAQVSIEYATSASEYAVSAQYATVLAARMGVGGDLIGNPIFQDWPEDQQHPTMWGDLVAGSHMFSRGELPSKYGSTAWRVDNMSATTCYISTQALLGDYYYDTHYVLDVDVELVEGSIDGAGIIIEHNNTDNWAIYDLKTTAEKAGNFYRIKQVIQLSFVTADQFEHLRVYWVPNLEVMGDVQPKVLLLHKLSLRPATAEERRTFHVAEEINASISEQMELVISEDGLIGAKYGIKVDLNGYITGYGLIATSNNGVPVSEMTFLVDSFRVVQPLGPGDSGTPKTLFAVGERNGEFTLILNDQLVGDLSIGGNALQHDIIEAKHLTTTELITDSAQIGEAIIGDAHVDELSASKLKADSAIAGSITVNGKPLSDIENIQANAPGAGIRINYSALMTPENGFGFIHGFGMDGDAADVDGYIVWNGARATLVKGEIRSGGNNVESFICYDFNAPSFSMQGGAILRYAQVQRIAGGQWQYWNDASWVNFTMNLSNHGVIGVIKSGSTEIIDFAEIWGTAIRLDRVYEADRINDAFTQIDPGKILISGNTSLADWRGTNTTLIDGGYMEADTLAGETLKIGLRGLTIQGLVFDPNSPAVNQLSWTSHTIQYTGDDGNLATRSVTSGSATWSSDTLYVYWTKGGTTLQTTTSTATAFGANVVVLATYTGGMNLVAKQARTIIDGSGIKTDAIDTVHLKSNSVVSDKIESGAVRARHMEIASRGLEVTIEFEHNSPVTDSVSWTAGSITYTADSGLIVTNSVLANPAGVAWTSGVLIIYWVMGAGTLSTTTDVDIAFATGNVVLASYSGGTNLFVSKGKSVIDGNSIKTGTITAINIQAGSIDSPSLAFGAVTEILIFDEFATYTRTGGASSITAGPMSLASFTPDNPNSVPIISFTEMYCDISSNGSIGGSPSNQHQQRVYIFLVRNFDPPYDSFVDFVLGADILAGASIDAGASGTIFPGAPGTDDGSKGTDIYTDTIDGDTFDLVVGYTLTSGTSATITANVAALVTLLYWIR